MLSSCARTSLISELPSLRVPAKPPSVTSKPTPSDSYAALLMDSTAQELAIVASMLLVLPNFCVFPNRPVLSNFSVDIVD
jgi:hypothetical protein